MVELNFRSIFPASYWALLFFIAGLPVPGCSSAVLALRGGGGNGQAEFAKPSRPLSALKQSNLQPDDLWPSEPPFGHLNHRYHGYLKEEQRSKAAVGESDRIPSVLHRVIFLGTDRDITESELLGLMDEQMSTAYSAWTHQNQNKDGGFRFELYNLAKAEAYLEEFFEDQVLAAFRMLQPHAYKSDLFRYLVLYNEGGWYVDLKLGMANPLSLNELLERLAAEHHGAPETIGFVGTGQNMVWNVPGAEGAMNAFLGAKPRHTALGDTVVRVVDDILARRKGETPWSLTGPYALFVGLGKRKGDGRRWRDFQSGEQGVALMRFGFDEWHLPESDAVVVRKAARGECGGGWANIGGNNYVDMWFADAVFAEVV